jgi:predicted acetyltransferase
MGLDCWIEDLTESQYLESCHKSKKYQSGTWYVLEKEGELVSSLIVFSLESDNYGIGSIATSPIHRNQGFASELIREVIQKLETKKNSTSIFLYSDIDSNFYRKFDFIVLPKEFQKYTSSKCMIRPSSNILLIESKSINVPNYF